MINIRPFAVAVSFDEDTIIISGAYPRQKEPEGHDLLTTAITAAMEFAAINGAEFAIIDPNENDNSHGEEAGRGR